MAMQRVCPSGNKGVTGFRQEKVGKAGVNDVSRRGQSIMPHRTRRLLHSGFFITLLGKISLQHLTIADLSRE